MKTNELFTLTNHVADISNTLVTDKGTRETLKKDARETADKVINAFGNDFEGLMKHLTASFKAMEQACIFGVRSEEKASGKTNPVTMRKQAAARFFHRSFNVQNKDNWRLSGSETFTVKPIEVVRNTPLKKLVETCERLGMDAQAITEVKWSFAAYHKRQYLEALPLRKLAMEEKARHDEKEQAAQIETVTASMKIAGCTVEEIETATAAMTKQA